MSRPQSDMWDHCIQYNSKRRLSPEHHHELYFIMNGRYEDGLLGIQGHIEGLTVLHNFCKVINHGQYMAMEWKLQLYILLYRNIYNLANATSHIVKNLDSPGFFDRESRSYNLHTASVHFNFRFRFFKTYFLMIRNLHSERRYGFCRSANALLSYFLRLASMISSFRRDLRFPK